jgi:hypothetical protein
MESVELGEPSEPEEAETTDDRFGVRDPVGAV